MNYIQKYMKRTLASFFMGKFALKMNWLDTPSSYLTRKGLRCDFHTSVKGMWLPHLPRLGRADGAMGSYASCLFSKVQHPFLHAVTTNFSGHFYSQS